MNIGLIAHDAKKTLLQNLCIAYRSVLAKHTLYATGTSGRLVEEATGLNVRKYLAGHVGGVQQMGSQIEQNDLDLVIFLRDPEQPKQHEPDVHRIIRLCDVHSIPLATNLATAEMLIKSLDRGEMEYYRKRTETACNGEKRDCSGKNRTYFKPPDHRRGCLCCCYCGSDRCETVPSGPPDGHYRAVCAKYGARLRSAFGRKTVSG